MFGSRHHWFRSLIIPGTRSIPCRAASFEGPSPAPRFSRSSTTVRKNHNERHPVRVAVTTGSSDRDRLDAVTALGPELFLLKPIDLAELIDGLKRDD